MKNLLTIIAVVMLTAAFAFAQGQGSSYVEKGMIHSMELPVIQTQLKPGPGLDQVSTLCNVCHSLDYITMQPPFPRATWTAEVNKMIKVMGAPINEEDAKTIIDYLATNYGTGK